MADSKEGTHEGSCFCGAVKVQVEGDPAMQGFCHCTDCRGWSAAPVNGFALWPADKVKVIQGEDKLSKYTKDGRSVRRSCTVCGGAVMTEHPGMGLLDVYASILSGYHFAPQAHVFYAERMIDMSDDLPTFRDLPAEVGGSGETIAA